MYLIQKNVWSRHQATSRRLLTAAFLSLSALTIPVTIRGEPTGGNVTQGQATIQYQGANTNINQSTQNAAIEWQNFSVGPGEHTAFTVPDASSITLNRVVGGNVSQILGQLSSNGQLYLINPTGILFGPNSRVDVAGLLASTENGGSITHQGIINSSGNITFAAPLVDISGHMTAGGKIGLYSDVYGNGLLLIHTQLLDPTFTHHGTGYINVDGQLTSKNVSIHGAIIHIGGTINVSGQQNNDGGEAIVFSEKETIVSGSILARGGSIAGNGGFIETSSYGVLNIAGASIDTSAIQGHTGQWLLDPPDYTLDQTVADTIMNNLNNTNVSIETATTGTGNGNIFISAVLTVPNSGGNTLSLNAFNNIIFTAGSKITTSLGATLNLRADSTGTTQDTAGQGTIIGDSGLHLDGAGQVNLYYRPYSNNGSGVLDYTLSNTFFNDFIYSGDEDHAGTSVTRWELISSTADGEKFMQDTNSGAVNHNIFLTRNITAWSTPIELFSGKIDGNFKTISNGVYTNAPSGISLSNIGLFRVLDYVEMQNLTLDNIQLDITGDASLQNFGILAGLMTGTSPIGSYTTILNNINITNASININSLPGGVVQHVGLVAGQTTSSTTLLSNITVQGSITDTLNGGDGSNYVGGVFGSANYVAFDNFYIQDTISNVLISAKNYVGGVIGAIIQSVGATVNLDRVDNLANITGEQYVGGIIGSAEKSYSLYNLRNFGTINIKTDTFGTNIGGLVGELLGGNLQYSTNFGNITRVLGTDTTLNVGGILGYVNNGSVRFNNNYGNISIETNGSANLDGHVGGIIGYAINSYVDNVTNAGNILHNNTDNTQTDYSNSQGLGGIIGFDIDTDLNNSLNTGNISGINTINIGGIIGYFSYNNSTTVTGVNFGNISGEDGLGGIVGYFTTNNYSRLANVVNFGDVTLNRGFVDPNNYAASIGGIVGFMHTNYFTPVDGFANYGNLILNLPDTDAGYVFLGGVAGSADILSFQFADRGIVATTAQQTGNAANNTWYRGTIVGSGSYARDSTNLYYDDVRLNLTPSNGNNLVDLSTFWGGVSKSSDLDNPGALGLSFSSVITSNGTGASTYAVPYPIVFSTVTVMDLSNTTVLNDLDGQTLLTRSGAFISTIPNFSRIMYNGTTAQAFRIDGSTGVGLFIDGTWAKGMKASGGDTVYSESQPSVLYANTVSFQMQTNRYNNSNQIPGLNDYYGYTFDNIISSALHPTLTSSATNIRFGNDGASINDIRIENLNLTGTGKLWIDDDGTGNHLIAKTWNASNLDFVFNQDDSVLYLKANGSISLKSISLAGPSSASTGNTLYFEPLNLFNTMYNTAQYQITAINGFTTPDGFTASTQPFAGYTGTSNLRWINGETSDLATNFILNMTGTTLPTNTSITLPQLHLIFNGDFNSGIVLTTLGGTLTIDSPNNLFNTSNFSNASFATNLGLLKLLEFVSPPTLPPTPPTTPPVIVSTPPTPVVSNVISLIKSLIDQLVQAIISPAQTTIVQSTPHVDLLTKTIFSFALPPAPTNMYNPTILSTTIPANFAPPITTNLPVTTPASFLQEIGITLDTINGNNSGLAHTLIGASINCDTTTAGPNQVFLQCTTGK